MKMSVRGLLFVVLLHWQVFHNADASQNEPIVIDAASESSQASSQCSTENCGADSASHVAETQTSVEANSPSEKKKSDGTDETPSSITIEEYYANNEFVAAGEAVNKNELEAAIVHYAKAREHKPDMFAAHYNEGEVETAPLRHIDAHIPT